MTRRTRKSDPMFPAGEDAPLMTGTPVPADAAAAAAVPAPDLERAVGQDQAELFDTSTLTFDPATITAALSTGDWRLAEGPAELPVPPVMVVILDVSYSMDDRDAMYKGQRVRRIDAAKAQLIEIQAQFPGQVAIIAFSDEAQAVPGGVAQEPNGWTNLHLALELARQADTGAMKFCIISDGLPQMQESAYREAEKFSVPLDVIYVGGQSEGRRFMQDFAQKTGGQFYTDASTMQLTVTIAKMLTASDGPIVTDGPTE